MVSTAGLTRSNGSVSQAGKLATAERPRKAATSWARCSASTWVAGTATTGRPWPSLARAETTKGRTASGTESTAAEEPATVRRGAMSAPSESSRSSATG